MDKNWFYLIEQASDMSKNKLSFIICACCLNKTTKTSNELTNEQPSSHFFLTDPLSDVALITLPVVSYIRNSKIIVVILILIFYRDLGDTIAVSI